MKIPSVSLPWLLLCSACVCAADNLGFTPLPSSVDVGSLEEHTPFLLADGLQQELLVNFRAARRLPRGPSGGSNFDMLTLNESGVDAGRYLFRTHELSGGRSGVSRTDLQTGESLTVFQRTDLDNVDGILWTPWGSILFNEEVSYTDQRDPSVPDAVHGLVYEITNPLASSADLNVIARPALGSTAQEGITLDAVGNFYVIDEWYQGAIYKFTPSTLGDLSRGQLFALGDATPEDGVDLGVARWIPLNDTDGAPLEGVTDPTIDARAAAVDVGALVFDRPEDLAVGTLANGNQSLYAALTSNSRVLSIELTEAPFVRDFVNSNTIDLATGLPVGDALNWPDNLAIDSDGRVYIVEDNNPGDIWTALDADADGVAEGIGRWASLSAEGSEPTGLYFNPFNPHEAFVNVQHPYAGPPRPGIGDATFRILIPEPTSFTILALGLGTVASTRRRRCRLNLAAMPCSK